MQAFRSHLMGSFTEVRRDSRRLERRSPRQAPAERWSSGRAPMRQSDHDRAKRVHALRTPFSGGNRPGQGGSADQQCRSTASTCTAQNLNSGIFPSACDRRVVTPLCLCSRTPPMTRMKGYVASGSSSAPACSARTKRAQQSSVWKRASSSRHPDSLSRIWAWPHRVTSSRVAPHVFTVRTMLLPRYSAALPEASR